VAVAETYAIPRSLARRRISPRALVGIAVAGLGIAVLTVLYRAEQPRQVLVLRLTRDLPAGAVLSAADLQPAAEAIPDDVAATLVPASQQPQLLGRRVGAPLTAGEYLTRGQLGHTNRGISTDQRLVVIPVEADTVAGLNLMRGDQVELTATNKQQAGGARTDVVVPAATIYEVGALDSAGSVLGSAQRAAGSGGRQTWISLLVAEDQVPAVNQARSTGDLQLALVPEAGPVQ
jgi:hypothetical protein